MDDTARTLSLGFRAAENGAASPPDQEELRVINEVALNMSVMMFVLSKIEAVAAATKSRSVAREIAIGAEAIQRRADALRVFGRS